MKVERLLAEREADWAALEALVDRAGRRRGLPGADVLRLGALYRSAAADLALLRRQAPGDPALARLEGVVVRARQAVYGGGRRRPRPVELLTRTYWRRVAERPGLLVAAAVLLLGPAAIAAAWALDDTAAAMGIVPGAFQQAVEPVADAGMDATESAVFSTSVLTNNIQVAALSFAAGIVLAVGAAFVLVYNGAILGAVAGGAIAAGNGAVFAEFVTAHGVIELTCIIVTAAAGMRMGLALIDPGPLPRGAALVREARAAVVVVAGTVPWIVLAGLIEGYVTRAGFGLVPGAVLGVGVGAAYWALVLTRGRVTGAPAPSR